MPLPKEYLFPQSRFCVPFSAMYKKALDDEFTHQAVQPVIEKLQKIIGKICEL